jgi:hypothetical protein
VGSRWCRVGEAQEVGGRADMRARVGSERREGKG